MGAYFLHSSENKNAGKHQVISFGGMLPVHMVDTYDLDLYLAPGFGIHMIKGLNNGASGEDQTTFGPMWKIGFLYKVSSNVRIGLEQSQIRSRLDVQSAAKAGCHTWKERQTLPGRRSPCRQWKSTLRQRDKEKLIAVYRHAGKAASPLPTSQNHHVDPR